MLTLAQESPILHLKSMGTTKKIDVAVGSQEAAALMGVHWTTPGKMTAKGWLSCREIRCGMGAAEERAVAVFSRRECEENWADYAKELASGGSGKRPRSHIDSREEVASVLDAAPQIAFDDAIGAAEAAEILGVSACWPPRMAVAGELVGRVFWSARSQAAKLWVFSRESVVANRLENDRRRLMGTAGRGRPRHAV